MCKARRMNDQMHCHACGYQWDIDDEDRPMCKPGMMSIVALALCIVATPALAKDCDASDAAVQLRSMLSTIGGCYTASKQYGSTVAAETAACKATVDRSDRYMLELGKLVLNDCTAYYNGPSVAERATLNWYSKQFGELAK